MKVDDPSEIDYRYMTSVGNGHLATLLYSDTIYVNGLYNGPTGWSHRARIPATQALFLSHPGITDRLYSLDVKRAVFEETFNVGEVKVTHRTYAHQYYTRLLVTEIILSTSSAQSTPVSIQVRNNRGEDSNDIEFSNNVEYINSNYRYQKGQTKIPELSDGKTQPVYIYYTVIPQVITLSAMTTHNKYTFVTSIDLEDWASKNTFDEALRILDVHPDNLYNKHISEWHIKWFNGRIDVDGNTELSKYIYSCFYYLMSFLPSQNVFLPNRKFSGLSPGGLANGANWTDYQGHVFWDMETWMYPGILMFHPELAQEMLSYRTDNMKPAYERAKANGQEGLRYPWESARTGVEVTPDVCVACRENQQHVTGDIALAARQYVSATRDVDWLRGKKGYVFIRDMAKYWYTRPEYNEVTKKYDINGVMPPDEHAESVNNSVYTNVGAKLSINFARYAACLAGEDSTGEVPDEWLERAKKIALPFDERKMFHPEYDGYREDKDPRGIKQADVILLGFPQMWPVDDEVRRNDLIHYEKVNNPLGPAMTWGMFSINWLELGEDEKAADLFKRSYSLYTREPFKIWTEARAGIGAVNFLTGMGGFLQTVLFGYGGARLHTEKLTFNPKLPPSTEGLRFTGLNYVGNSLDIVIKPDYVTVVARMTSEENPLILTVNKSGASHKIQKDKEILITRQAFTLRSLSVSDCPLPEGDSCPDIITRREWQAVEPRDTEITGVVDKVIIQQTGDMECNTLDACKKRVKKLQLIHQTSGVKGLVLGDIAYNFLIGSDGRVYKGRGWGLGPYHPDVDVRLSSLSIAFVGDFTCTDISDEAKMAAQQLIKCARERKKISRDYKLVFESQMFMPLCKKDTCDGDKLFCVVQSWFQWSNIQTGGGLRQPNCNGKCKTDDIPNSKILPLYEDTSKIATVFATERLPMKPSTSEIDYRFMASVGNGHIATVVYSDTIYMNGLYNGPSGWSHRARIPSILGVRLSLPGVSDTQTQYALDVQRGVFEEIVNSSDVSILMRTYAHQYYTQLMILEIHAVRVGNGGNSIDISLNNDYDSSSIDLTLEPPQQYKQNYRYISATTKETETADTSVSSVFIYQHIIPSKLTLASNVGKSSWVYFMSIDNDGRKAEAAFNEGLRLLKQQTFLLYYQHVAAWKQAWNKGRIEVGDNLQLSKLINSCFYYLISFLPAATTFLPKEQFYGLSPGGLANGANWTDYQGHVFWDMETWMYPGILAFRPDLANDMLSYRIYGMKEAAKRAKQGNYEGLRYPWESAFTGAEQTPDICIPCRENQQHVTGDIALAARQYFSMTQDMTWLKNQSGYEFIRDMGKFWKSRPTWNPVTQQYDINGVMPPDEHAESVNNSVYTNVGAKLSIYYANYVACLMDNTKDDTESWLAVADKIAVSFDSKNNVHPEYDGYYDGNDDRGVKQADVILLGFPQMWPMSREVRKNDLLKYEIVTNPMGPAMTWGMFSIGWLELGEEEKAADLFRMSYGNYIREPFKIWTEARAGIGAVNFLTGMGGFLQSVIFGYGGLRIHPEYIEFNPRLTPDTTFLRFVDFDYLGNSLDIEIQTGFVSIVATKIDDEHPLVIYVIPTGNIVYIEKDKELRLARTPFIMASSSVTECPLPTGSSSCVTPISKSVWGGKTVPTASNLVTPVRDVIIFQTNTSSCYSYQACNMAMQSLETSQIKNGKTHLTYNFVIGSNLRVYEARGWTKPGDHSDDRNSQSIGIAVIGNFTYNQPSKALLAVLQQLIKCGMENKYISKSYQLIWEKQLEKSDCAVGCPGDQLYCQLTQWRHWKRVDGDSLPYCGELYIIQSTSAPRKTPEPTSTSSSLYVNYSLFLSFSVVISYFYGY
ncbi:hypothetical protein SNE40_010234 [Patella caerulea]